MLISVMVAHAAIAQENPVSWTFSSTKVDDHTFDIYLKAAVARPWHIYSQHSPDDAALPTKISFSANPLLSISKTIKENGKMISKYEEVFETTVRYFEGPAEFVVRVRLQGRAKTNVAGSIEYMACNDSQCLPPATVKFSVPLP